MAKKSVHPDATKLSEEICKLMLKYIQGERSKRKMWAYVFCDEIGIAHGVYTRITGKSHCAININTACKILDKIGYELKIVKKAK